MRHNKNSDRTIKILSDPEIPRTENGGLKLCKQCQRRIWFAGGFLYFLSDELESNANGRARRMWYRK